MEHLLFTIWMLLFPITESIGSYIGVKSNILKDHEYYDLNEEDSGVGALLIITIYFFVGYLLY